MATTLEKASAKISAGLQANLLDLLLLDLQVKQAHWNIVGPKFLPIHEFLDTVHDQLQAAIDDTAERIRQLGEFPDGNASAIADNGTIAPMPEGEIRDDEVVTLLLHRLEVVSSELRKRLKPMEEDDVVTADMVHQQIHDLEKAAWMLRSIGA